MSTLETASPSARIKRSSSVIGDVRQSIETTKKRRTGVVMQVFFLINDHMKAMLTDKGRNSGI